jgi:predicted secreted protein
MGVFSAVVVFILTWWMVFFMALPFGVKAQGAKENVADGLPAAPQKPLLKKKLIATTIISVILSVVIIYLINIKVIDFRELGAAMYYEDFGTE